MVRPREQRATGADATLGVQVAHLLGMDVSALGASEQKKPAADSEHAAVRVETSSPPFHSLIAMGASEEDAKVRGHSYGQPRDAGT